MDFLQNGHALSLLLARWQGRYHPGVTRFHLAFAVAVLLCVAALLLESISALVAIILAFLILTGFGVAFPQMKFFGPYICRGSQSRKQVALTFDDGPDARSTPALLQFLTEARVPATFFCIGERVTANPSLARRIVGDGHLLENHTYSHSKATNLFSVGRLRDELSRTQDAVLQSAGVAPSLFRPPMGLSNPRVFEAARSLGLKVIGWTVRGLDTTLRDPERIVARILRRLKPGAIIMLHDANVPPERLVATVKQLLESLRARGYEVVRLDRILVSRGQAASSHSVSGSAAAPRA